MCPGDLGYILGLARACRWEITLLSLFKQFVALSMLRIRPQDLPAHPLALQLSVLLALIVSMVGLMANYSIAGAFARSILALAVSAAFVYVFLYMQGKQSRFNQSLCAICGASTVIYLVALPLMPYFTPDANGEYNLVFIVLILLLDGWSLIVTGFIFRHSFDIPFGRGIALALLLMFVTLIVFGFLSAPEVSASQQLSAAGGG